ncbi:MAG: FkbM family methyltransferase [Verrucomicrobiae bacterium]|nr:FkbM family methyltransferase [Verrucomicrobiae bacterium]
MIQKWITRLSRSACARKWVKKLGFIRLANQSLKLFPLTKTLSGSGVKYRMAKIESVVLSEEMFSQQNLYESHYFPQRLETFADLGCNVGYFTCWLTHVRGGKPLRGVMVDANPEAVAEARWHAKVNHWNEVVVLQGLVGEINPNETKDFFVYESNVCSASQPLTQEELGLQGEWEKIAVPGIVLEEVWKKRFGETRCHLLKLDVEGSELNFLQKEIQFLQRVDAICIEWHTWAVDFETLRQILEKSNFKFVKILHESELMGTAYFVKG